jgi:hypothetical protein
LIPNIVFFTQLCKPDSAIGPSRSTSVPADHESIAHKSLDVFIIGTGKIFSKALNLRVFWLFVVPKSGAIDATPNSAFILFLPG